MQLIHDTVPQGQHAKLKGKIKVPRALNCDKG